MCKNACDGNGDPFQHWIDSGGWGKILIHWKIHPLYGGNPNFLKDIHEKQKLSWQTINQEYNLSFQESESNYFSVDTIRNCATGNNENYQENCFYFLGVDSATTGKDYAVCVVLKYENEIFSLVNLYRKREQSSEYHLYHIGEVINNYQPTLTGVEVTGGVGQVWLEELSKNHFGTKFKKIVTTGDSKPAMLDRLKLMMESQRFIYPSNSPIVDELLNFKRNDKKLEAASGKHDDIIMSVAFALTVAEFWEFN